VAARTDQRACGGEIVAEGRGPEHGAAQVVRYRKELRMKKDALKMLKQTSEEHTVTLVYGARDEEHNEALVLKKILEGSK
jgi:uncharacterized protein YeaO (DUF488 family)